MLSRKIINNRFVAIHPIGGVKSYTNKKTAHFITKLLYSIYLSNDKLIIFLSAIKLKGLNFSAGKFILQNFKGLCTV